MNTEHQWAQGIRWYVVSAVALLHVGALASLFFFSWQGLITAVILYFLTGMFGVAIGLHRYFTHGSFKTSKGVHLFLALCAQLALQSPIIIWVAVHRLHHKLSDKEGDPHSPRDGAWWAHMLWLFPYVSSETIDEGCRKWAPDLYQDRVIRIISSSQLLLSILLGAILFGIGTLVWGYFVGISMVLWGMCMRTCVLWHVTWAVNSASHMWGYQLYPTPDHSTNNPIVGPLSFGEGWHNNHHAYPTMAAHGHKWWELDFAYYTIWLMEKLRLVWDVKHDTRRPKASA